VDISVEAESNADTAQLHSLTILMQVVKFTFSSIDLFSDDLEENRVSRLLMHLPSETQACVRDTECEH